MLQMIKPQKDTGFNVEKPSQHEWEKRHQELHIAGVKVKGQPWQLIRRRENDLNEKS
jgi:hypothetical protein